MEEREGAIKSYDATAKTAVVTDSYTGGDVDASNVGGIGAGANLPVGAVITYISIYLPPKGQTEVARIINIIKELKG